MAAMSKADLEAAEAKYGLTPGDLTYQLRCSRIAAYAKGEPWSPPKTQDIRRGTIESGKSRPLTPQEAVKLHPLYGQRVIITPLMAPDKNRNVYFDEPVGHDIEVEEMAAGRLLYGAPEDVDRIVGDYKIIRENPSKVITAKTTLPKSGQEISFMLGTDLVPVVRGNDGQRGYIWAYPTHVRQIGDTMLQLLGLKTLITQISPELLPKFSGQPVMFYIDGLVLAASIPLTNAILKEHRLKEMQNARLGF